MDILLVAFDFKPAPGGIGELTHRIARNLHDQGHGVDVVSRTMDGDADFDLGCPYPVHRVDLPGGTVRGPRSALRVLSALRDQIHRTDPDFLVCNTLAHGGYLCRIACKLTGVPFVLLAHGTELTRADRSATGVKDRIFWALQRFKRDLAVKGADMVICNSRFTESVVHDLGVDAERTAVVHPGCDPDPPEGDPETLPGELREFVDEARVLLTLTRLVPRKGIDRTLEAVAHLADDEPGLRYIVAGGGPDRSRLEDLADRHGVADQVYFTGYVDDPVKHALMEVADLFVMPNRFRPPGDYEGFGIVFLEAASHGLPVVAGRSGGAPEAVADDKTGYLVDPTDPDEVAAALIRLLEHPEVGEDLGAAGRRRVEEDFSWDRVVAEFADVVSTLRK